MDGDGRFWLNHTGAPLARTTNGTLELSVDESGLKYRAALADTQDGRDMYKLIKRGDITQSSFAFTIGEQEFSEDRSVRRVLKVARLLDVSPVTYPAYPTTTVAARQMATGSYTHLTLPTTPPGELAAAGVSCERGRARDELAWEAGD